VVSDPFADGQLPSQYEEAQPLVAVRRLLREQVDMQFSDLRALLRLPSDQIAPKVGCNLTAAAMIFNQISGFSIWFFHNRQAQVILGRERKRKAKTPFSGQRFKGFVRAYYPRAIGEPALRSIADKLYEARNLLSHNLGVGDLKSGSRRREVAFAKPTPPLDPMDIVDLELQVVFPAQGVPVRGAGLQTVLSIPGLYWTLGRMLRAALADQPDQCEPTGRGAPRGAAGPSNRDPI
jgi:hypothetical protein